MNSHLVSSNIETQSTNSPKQKEIIKVPRRTPIAKGEA